MKIYVIGFKSPEVEDCKGMGPVPIYSQVWERLSKEYGHPIFNNGTIQTFSRGRGKESATLTDNSGRGNSDVHELVLLGDSKKLADDLEGIITAENLVTKVEIKLG